MAEEIRFYLLDIAYKVIDDKPVIYLFGRTIDGKQVCVTDDSLEPYFYVIPNKGKDIRVKLEQIKIENKEGVSQVIKTELENKKYLGDEIEAIKVYTKLPRDVPIIVDAIKSWDSIKSIHEYDILFTRRYLIDRGITPLTLCRADGEYVHQKMRVLVFKAKKIEQFSEDAITNPKILAFDIETYNPIGKDFNPGKYPILMLSFHSINFNKVFVWKKFITSLNYIEFVETEAELIEKFKETIDQFGPDLLVGYFSDGFDLPYIKKRAELNKIKLDIGLDYSEIKTSGAKKPQEEIVGIPHVDIFKFIKAIFGGSLEADKYDLNTISSEILGEKKTEVNIGELAHVWDENGTNLEKFCEYNLKDSVLAYKLCDKMLPDIIEIVKMIGIKLYDVNRMGFSQLVEWYILRQAKTFNEIAPNRPSHDEVLKRRMQTFKGAFVFEPTPGLYKDIVVFDYRSLYPTIISAHNISPGTLDCTCCPEKEPSPAGNNHWFCTKKRDLIPSVIEDIISRRARIKEILKDKTAEHKMLNARQKSLKLLANAFYGYLGFFGARWYSLECAKATTAYGRDYIHKVIDMAKKNNFHVIYSDTDSVFLTLDKKTRKDAEKFLDSVNATLPRLMEMEFEGFYPSGIFVSAKAGEAGAKKKYALISEDGNLKIRGFEAIRRNWSSIAQEVQQEVLNIILKEHNAGKAMEYVKKVILDLRNREVPIEKVVIHTQLQKDIGSYDAIGPHVAVAQRLINKGVTVGPGSTISYVITYGKDRIRDRAKLPEEVKGNEYDPDYYVNNQVIPSVERILNVFGYKKEDLSMKKEQKQLGKFF